MSPLLTYLVNFLITMALLAILIYGARWIYLQGVKDGEALKAAEIRRDQAQKALAETKAAL